MAQYRALLERLVTDILAPVKGADYAREAVRSAPLDALQDFLIFWSA